MGDLLTIFLTVFLAELGDKTQLATLLYAGSGERSPLTVFLAAAGALVTSTGLAVLLGTVAQTWLAALPMKLIAGIGFFVLGGMMIVQHFRG